MNALRKPTVAHPEDWDQWLPYILSHSLLERSKQLRNLVDNVRSNIILTISKTQTAQMKRQNPAKKEVSQL
jgi:hypothetical protein